MNKGVMFFGLMLLLLLASCGVKDDTAGIQDRSVEINESIAGTETSQSSSENQSEQAPLATDTEPNSENISDEGMMMEESEKMINEDVTMEQKTEVTMQQEESIQGSVEPTQELAGEYTNYDSSLIGVTNDTVLFFHASWCPSCAAADTGISAGVIPEGLTILKTDYDSSTDLRKKYRVVAQHTFVQVDADGNEIKKWVGGTSVDDIVERVQ